MNSPLTFLYDPLSLFFLGVILIVAIPSLVYSIGYFKGSHKGAKAIEGEFLTLAFVSSMALVVTVNNAFIFLVAWELMSLTSYFLVLFERENERSVRAGTIYIIMTHIGTAFLITAFLIMYRQAGSFDLLAIKAACLTMPAQLKDIVFIFLLIGFGTKAGIVPLHVWLPYAHPQAPSPVSSLMSGVMIKTAIYGMARFIIDILGVGAPWWGLLVLVLAAVSSLVGVIYALMEHDIKKLLAYHSVENIGIILFGVGACLFFLSMKMNVLAVFALIAGLYHLVNHAIFKGLLFLCAGSVYKATGTRDIEKLGGLIHNMPQTAAYFLLGALAISAIPPLNGFVSEWLTFQVFFAGAVQGTNGIKVFWGLCAAALAFTSGLAAACFVKAFGITFLGLPRSRQAQDAKEVSSSMRFGMLFLSLLVVIFGLAAVPIIRLLTRVSGSVCGIDTGAMSFGINNFVIVTPVFEKGIYLSTPLIALSLLAIISIAGGAFYLFLRHRPLAVNKTWDCGYYKLSARHEYTATAFSKPFRIAFSFFLMPYRKTQKIRDSFYHVKSLIYETHTTPVFKKYMYIPMINSAINIARFLRRLQPGSIHLYIAYIFVTAVALIIFRGHF